ncbi:MAG: hypothetical protein OEY87_08005 [Gammaproteobacteria bacterium]|nr:hypothetical protein [Gammaproteobacteria bacterium]MDH5736051.1 hypothetical protein [Gammaproteobacteria bacterium]
MNIINKRYSRPLLILVTVNCVLFTQTTKATEWWDSVESQSGFSEFAPPSSLSEYNINNNKGKTQWRSGSSFNDDNKVRYLPVTSKNPWKPVKTSHYKKSFSGQRPWGNVPDKRPGNTSNMKLHDQRFKQWSHQLDSSFQQRLIASDPMASYDRYSFPFVNGYGYPGSIYKSPLITPPIHPGLLANTAGYGLYPGGLYPYTGLSTRPWLW